MISPESDLEMMAAALDATGRYRVLRQLARRPSTEPPAGVDTRLAIFVDVETTGLDPSRDEIIELAMVPFTYGLDGQIFQIHEAFEKFQEPRQPIPTEITALTGITNEMVAGQVIDPNKVAMFAGDAALIIAHNAAFDRRFAERVSPVFTEKPWACSMTQIDWSGEGYEGTKLAYLAMGAGFFYERHRAAHDCLAAIELLTRPLPKARVPGMARLLDQARRPSWRIWAENSPYDRKELLKARGYRWNSDATANHPRAWYIDVDDNARDQELSYLRTMIYSRNVDPLIRRITAHERFSERA